MRREAGLSQAVVAGRLDKSQSFVAKYESGERRLDVVEFIDVAGAIGFDAAKLIGDVQSREDEQTDATAPRRSPTGPTRSPQRRA